jgi:hypothetical protein
VAGPEEMKWPSKELYTYNVRDGDSFILDEKVAIGKMKTRCLSYIPKVTNIGCINF